jgi:hypothetical protein
VPDLEEFSLVALDLPKVLDRNLAGDARAERIAIKLNSLEQQVARPSCIHSILSLNGARMKIIHTPAGSA